MKPDAEPVAGLRSPVADVESAAPSPATGERGPATDHWRRWYAIVLLELALTIALFYAFTRAFA